MKISQFKTTFIFVAGIACGAAMAWTAAKNKYETILEEEIQSVKDTYKNRQPLVVSETKEETTEIVEEKVEISQELRDKMEDGENYIPTPTDKKEYAKLLENNGYVNYGSYMEYGEKDLDKPYERNDLPFVIDDEEFGEDGYDTQTLTYYSDGVLVDEVDEVITDIDSIVGLENLKVFEEFGATSVMIRNDIYNCDFEVIKDDWNYSDLDLDHGVVENLKAQQEIIDLKKAEQEMIEAREAQEVLIEERKEQLSSVDKEKKPHEL